MSPKLKKILVDRVSHRRSVHNVNHLLLLLVDMTAQQDEH